MSTPNMSTTKRDDIYTEVAKNPDMGTSAKAIAFLKRIITDMGRYFTASCRLARYPELIVGSSIGRAGASTDLTSLASNEFLIDVDGSGSQAVDITLANCTTGDATATEIQAQIQAIDVDGFAEVTVSYASGAQYTISSGVYGKSSRILISSTNDDLKHVAQALRLGPKWGGVEYSGGSDEPEADAAIAELTFAYYSKTGGGGSGSGGFGSTTTVFAPNQQTVVLRAEDVPARVKAIMASFRRI